MSNNGLVVGIVMVLVFVGGFFLGRMTAGEVNGNIFDGYETESESGDSSANGENTQVAPGEEVKVDASMMTDGQRKMLEAMGVDPNNVKITPEVIACAETRVGKERMVEIQNGATPSIIEGGKLFACYSSN